MSECPTARSTRSIADVNRDLMLEEHYPGARRGTAHLHELRVRELGRPGSTRPLVCPHRRYDAPDVACAYYFAPASSSPSPASSPLRRKGGRHPRR